MTVALAYLLWAILAFAYVANPKAVFKFYLLILPFFPFYWSPLIVPPINRMNVLQCVSVGIGLGMMVESFIGSRTSSLIARKKARKVFELGLFVLVLLWSISAFQFYGFADGSRVFIRNLLSYWIPFALAARIISDGRDLESLMRWIVFPALIIAVISLLEYLAQSPYAYDFFRAFYRDPSDFVWAPTLRDSSLRIQSTFGQAIFLAFYLLSGALMAFVLALRRIRGEKLITLLLAAFLFVCSFLPLVRGQLVAFAIVVLLALLLVGGRAVRYVFYGGLGLLVILFLVLPYLKSGSSFWIDFLRSIVGKGSLQTQASQLGTFEYRILLIGVGVVSILRGPAWGYGNPLIGESLGIPDLTNVFIELGLVSGLISVITLIIFVIALSVVLWKVWKQADTGRKKILAGGMILTFVLAQVCWMESSKPGQLNNLIWLSFGAIVGVYSFAQSQKKLTENA